MSVVLIETDLGTKDKCKKALARVQNTLNRKGKRGWNEWWNQVLADAIVECPKIFGSLSRTIRTENIGSPQESFVAESYVYIKDKQELLNKMIVAGGEIDMITGVNVNYAQAVHDGHVSTGGNWVAANPFLERAIEMNLPVLDAKNQQILKSAGDAWEED